jgi:hypothetical protein
LVTRTIILAVIKLNRVFVGLQNNAVKSANPRRGITPGCRIGYMEHTGCHPALP